MGSVRAAFKLLLFALWSLVIVPPQMLVLLVHKGRVAYILPHIWHKGVCRIFGIRFDTEGQPATGSQTIYVFNHLSYLDIPLIGSVLRASFVAKKDVKHWPVFGFLSKLQQTAFIDRARQSARRETDAIGAMIEEGRSLIIFPEGTSTDGRTVRPFKSSLFSLALQAHSQDLLIQPVTLVLEKAGGHRPETQDIRDLYAWHIDMDTPLPRHLWLFAKSSGATLRMRFHQPVKAAAHDDRKTLARLCEKTVSEGLEIPRAA